jgi:hypothetical protein
MRSSSADLAAGIFSLLFAGVFFAQSGELEGVGLLYPQWLIGLISLGGLVLLLQGLNKRRGRDSIVDKEVATYSRVGIITALSVGYALLISGLGFYPASVIFLSLSAIILNDSGEPPYKAACMLTIIMCFAVWLVFAVLLGVPTPEGMLLQ